MIIPEGERSTEKEIELALIAYLVTRAYGWSSYNDIFFHLRSYIQLTPGDLEVSRSRPTEKKWHMIVRNAYRKGGRDKLIVKADGGLQLASRIRKAS